MATSSSASLCARQLPDGTQVIEPTGAWTLASLSQRKKLTLSLEKNPQRLVLDGASLEALDTAGAKVLYDLALEAGMEQPVLSSGSEAHMKLFALVADRVARATHLEHAPRKTWIDEIADNLVAAGQASLQHLSFLGEALASFGNTLRRPTTFRVSDFCIQFERAIVRALPIVALTNFLIGLVVAYLFSNQAVKFGASIFVVDAVAIGACRELAPVLTAIIIAGRSGSAFTAQLGTMKISQEVDAIRVLGLSPMQVLVLPRVAALFVGLPLLVFVGNICGILGGLVIANANLGIPVPTFLTRLHSVLALRHVYVGIGKAPVFALVVALIGCRLGLNVEGNARSVGLNTTSTVVQSIVAVVILDAVFAVIFQSLGW